MSDVSGLEIRAGRYVPLDRADRRIHAFYPRRDESDEKEKSLMVFGI